MRRPSSPHVCSQLLETVRQLMMESGSHGSGVNDITGAAGGPKGSFYRYFNTKETFAVADLDD